MFDGRYTKYLFICEINDERRALDLTREITKYVSYKNNIITFTGSCFFTLFFCVIVVILYVVSLQKGMCSCNICLWQWVIYGLSKSEEVFPNYGVLTEKLIYVFPFLFQLVTQMLMAYLSRLSAIAGNKINCGPALTWMEVNYKAWVLLYFLVLAAEKATNVLSAFPERSIILPDLWVSLKWYPKSFISRATGGHGRYSTNRIRSSVNSIGAWILSLKGKSFFWYSQKEVAILVKQWLDQGLPGKIQFMAEISKEEFAESTFFHSFLTRQCCSCDKFVKLSEPSQLWCLSALFFIIFPCNSCRNNKDCLLLFAITAGLTAQQSRRCACRGAVCVLWTAAAALASLLMVFSVLNNRPHWAKSAGKNGAKVLKATCLCQRCCPN